jgi:hypothetical protein
MCRWRKLGFDDRLLICEDPNENIWFERYKLGEFTPTVEYSTDQIWLTGPEEGG